MAPATPHYNAHLLTELGARERHLQEIYSASQECLGLADAVILYKVWARQRGLDKVSTIRSHQFILILTLHCCMHALHLWTAHQGHGGFTGFHFSLLGSALLMQKKINRLMSCYQIFRVLLQHLSSTDWTTAGFLPTHLSVTSSAMSLEAFHSAYNVVFVDASGLLNVCADVGKGWYLWLQHEAALALKLLDDPTPHGFEALFMRPMPLELKWDILYRLVSC